MNLVEQILDLPHGEYMRIDDTAIAYFFGAEKSGTIWNLLYTAHPKFREEFFVYQGIGHVFVSHGPLPISHDLTPLTTS